MSECISERRAINILCAYWDELRGSRQFPTEKELDPEELTTIWPYCLMLKVIHCEEDMRNYECVYAGSEAVKLYFSDLRYYSGKAEVVVFFPQIVETLFDYLESVVENKRPIIEELEKATAEGHDVKVRQCLLPLGTGDTVDYIVGVIGGKVY